MKITRQNYEYWFIDFVEGVLTPEDEAMVRKFAQSNPDLNNELEDIQIFKLVPEHTNFLNKNLLKQNQLNAISGITKFEQLCVAYLENELNEKEQHELGILLNSSEKRENEFKLIQKIKLSADKRIKYLHKSTLKKLFVENKQTTYYKTFISIAALFILLIGLSFLFRQNSKNKLLVKGIAKNYHSYKFKKVSNINQTNITKFNEKAGTVVIQNQLKNNELKQLVVLQKKIVSISCKSVSNSTKNNNLIIFNEDINNNAYALNSQAEKEKTGAVKMMLNKLKLAGISMGEQISKVLKKEFKYKKTFTDDGRTLIAFKAGDFEYKISKKQKK